MRRPRSSVGRATDSNTGLVAGSSPAGGTIFGEIMKIVFVDRNVPYLPLPNYVEVVLTDELSPVDLTKTAFVVPVCDDGSIILANNVRRGLEISGGHIEDGETPEEAACREALEEVGCEVTDVVPIGYLRMVSEGEVPADYAYPHPISYQQFFAGRVTAINEYQPNEECNVPVRTSVLDGMPRKTIKIYGEAAKANYAR